MICDQSSTFDSNRVKSSRNTICWRRFKFIKELILRVQLWRGFDLVDQEIGKEGRFKAPDSGSNEFIFNYQNFQEKWAVVLIQ